MIDPEIGFTADVIRDPSRFVGRCVASSTSGQNASGNMRDFERLRAGRRRSEGDEQK